MRNIPETGADSMVWRLAGDSVLDLMAGHEHIAALQIGADWTKDCRAETADGRYVLSHTAPFQNEIGITKEGAATSLATFTHEPKGKGTASFACGRSFRFECSSVLKMDWRFQDSMERTVMELKPAFSQGHWPDLKKGIGRQLCTITLAKGAARLPEACILAILGAHRLLYIGGMFID